MNKEVKEDFKDIFKNTKEIKGYMGFSTDFKDIFKNVPELKKLPLVPENLDTTHLQEFIDEFESGDN